MKNVIVGTAGHIDHGKTTLIKALTGTDTDRLLEEKKRGITIDLGFTHFDLPSGRRAGIIDVPGHEKFIKNMLAGVGGIDIVLLVIAADEGFMPQTQEHLDILTILEVKKGIIVLTKVDLVDPEWLSLVQEEIREKVKDTFLRDAPMLAVSSTQGQGLKELVERIDFYTEETEEKNTSIPFRLPVDRVFTMSGFGTVITGTLIEGSVHEGDQMTIYPQELTAKVRNLHVHGKKVESAYAGQRVAINLSGVKKEDILRGNVAAEQNSMKETMMLDVKLNMLKHAERIIDNRDRLRLYHGTAEVLCRVVLLDREEIKPGESCYAQLRLEESIVAKRGDHFVIRFYSPMETLGGGVILEPNPIKHKRFKADTLEELKVKEEGSPEQILEKVILRFNDAFANIGFYATQTGLSENTILAIVDKLTEKGIIRKFSGTVPVHIDYLTKLEDSIIKVLQNYHNSNPLKIGMGKEELRNKLKIKIKGKLYDELLEHFENNQIIRLHNNFTALADFEVKYSPEQLVILEEIDRLYLEREFQTPAPEDFLNSKKNEQKYREVLEALIEKKQLIKINEDILLHVENYEKAKEMLKQFIKENGQITLSEFRDLIHTTRKYALPLIENFDQNKITKRIDEKRVLY
ncbi:selenocysteine-specific translation elongation factor [Geosporobacter ferrireducens]|uniref:Selenocysteine-specific elongation factor n=1 Tax=Geosporobacter ferrireducens TaxID=1424294 RepID=A0A1D8GPG3_9FIRM|nr:selenocysteine-specific translation elongation factor [Geosporobacter ferrireducens]AOT72785.1 selenocysteine-specific translation elongation factor [Geosporobacter ferrireducens]MTI55202.1 selenocysteine-specific translation elongation factor [Geosporobacter ferrireducens]